MTNILGTTGLLFLIILFGCNAKNNNDKEKQSNQYQLERVGSLKVIEIDHCEYFYKAFTHSIIFTHKGNCKFCNPIAVKKECDLGNTPQESVIGEQYEDALEPKLPVKSKKRK